MVEDATEIAFGFRAPDQIPCRTGYSPRQRSRLISRINSAELHDRGADTVFARQVDRFL